MTAIRHRSTGLYFCAEPYVVFETGRGKERKTVSLGTWCAVERFADAALYPSRNAAVRSAKEHGLTGVDWEPVKEEKED